MRMGLLQCLSLRMGLLQCLSLWIVWIHQPVLVIDGENFKEGLVLGRRYIQRIDMVGLLDEEGVVQLDPRSGTLVIVKAAGNEVKIRALMDTGAGPNIMTRGVWRELGSPALASQVVQLTGADSEPISAQGRFERVGVCLRSDQEDINSIVSFVVIETIGREKIVLGREFMTENVVTIDVTTDDRRSLEQKIRKSWKWSLIPSWET